MNKWRTSVLIDGFYHLLPPNKDLPEFKLTPEEMRYLAMQVTSAMSQSDRLDASGKPKAYA